LFPPFDVFPSHHPTVFKPITFKKKLFFLIYSSHFLHFLSLFHIFSLPENGISKSKFKQPKQEHIYGNLVLASWTVSVLRQGIRPDLWEYSPTLEEKNTQRKLLSSGKNYQLAGCTPDSLPASM
jgi:hypothetical protein